MPTYKQPISALVVIYTAALDVLLLHGKYQGDEVLDDILRATVEFWRVSGKAFWVFFA